MRKFDPTFTNVQLFMQPQSLGTVKELPSLLAALVPSGCPHTGNFHSSAGLSKWMALLHCTSVSTGSAAPHDYITVIYIHTGGITNSSNNKLFCLIICQKLTAIFFCDVIAVMSIKVSSYKHVLEREKFAPLPGVIWKEIGRVLNMLLILKLNLF